MSAPIRAQVEAHTEAEIGSEIRSNHATQDLWRLLQTTADTSGETRAQTDPTQQLEALLASGADINARDGEGVTALMMAAYNGRLQMVRALIDHGADLNATRQDGFTALGLAAFRGHTEVVKVLVERGADLSKVTPFGTSADMWATARSFLEIALYLERQRSGVPASNEYRWDARPSLPVNEQRDELSNAEPAPATQPTQSLPENQPLDDVPAAETIQQSQPIESELTIATPRITVADQLVSQNSKENGQTVQEIEHTADRPLAVVPDQLMSEPARENPGTGQGNQQSSAKAPVVRILKDPPEIWDLVRETPEHFNPRGAFVTRLTSSKTNLVLLMLVVILISGLATFGVMTLRDRNRGGEDAQAPEEHGSGQTVPGSQASAPANAPKSAALDASESARVDTPLNSQLNTTPEAADGVDNTPRTETAPGTTDPRPPAPQTVAQPENPASAPNALSNNVPPSGESKNASVAATGKGLSNSVRPTGVSGNSILARTVWLAGTAAVPGKKRITYGRRNADRSRIASGDSESVAAPEANAKPQPQNTADINKSSERNPTDASSATKRSNTTSIPQSIPPPKTSSTPKAKVIQWP